MKSSSSAGRNLAGVVRGRRSREASFREPTCRFESRVRDAAEGEGGSDHVGGHRRWFVVHSWCTSPRIGTIDGDTPGHSTQPNRRGRAPGSLDPILSRVARRTTLPHVDAITQRVAYAKTGVRAPYVLPIRKLDPVTFNQVHNLSFYFRGLNGGRSRTRTYDPLIKSRQGS